MEVDGLVQLFDHGEHLRAGFHVVVGIAENFTDDLVLGAAVGVYLIFECRKQLIVDEAD